MSDSINKDPKLSNSLKLLSASLKALNSKKDDPVLFAATSKAFEITFEYTWKYLKRKADSA
jgi:hypothetical protein